MDVVEADSIQGLIKGHSEIPDSTRAPSEIPDSIQDPLEILGSTQGPMEIPDLTLDKDKEASIQVSHFLHRNTS